MRLGLVFTGISHGLGRNYNHCFPNINSHLIECYKKDHDVKVYVASYAGAGEDIKNLYKPTLFFFEEYANSHQVLTYIKSMEQLRNQELDFIICTRFDIHFNKNINEIGLDYSKFNALFKERGWWDSMKFTTDNFFAFPYYMLEKFIMVLWGLYNNPSRPGQTDLHQAFYRMQNEVGIENTNIVSNIDELSNYNIFYSLCNTKWGIFK